MAEIHHESLIVLASLYFCVVFLRCWNNMSSSKKLFFSETEESFDTYLFICSNLAPVFFTKWADTKFGFDSHGFQSVS